MATKNIEEKTQTKPTLTQSTIYPIFTKLKKRKLVVIHFIVFSLIITSLILLGYQNYQLRNRVKSLPEQTSFSQTSPTPLPMPSSELDSEVLKNFVNYISKKDFYIQSETKFKPADDEILWWVSDDNWSIAIQDAPSIGIVRTKSYKELEDNNSFTAQLVNEITNFFLNNGYTKNARNSSKSIADKSFYDYIQGYQKDDERCLLTIDPNLSSTEKDGELIYFPTITISCSKELERSYNEQIPFLKAMDDRESIIIIEKQTELAVKAWSYGRRIGALTLFSKKNGYWEMIYRGTDQPFCSTLQEYSFPVEIHNGCLE